MISDSFPKERRATALSIYSSGLYIGGALALPIGAAVVSRWTSAYPDPASAPLGLAGWQAAFIAVGLPGLLLAFGFSLCVNRNAARPTACPSRSCGRTRGVNSGAS
jgi:MFS family permease